MKSSDKKIAEGILFTDQYQLTMAQLYFQMGMHEKPVQFDHFFRDYPDYGSHRAGYCINAGLAWFLDWLKEARFKDKELEYLRYQKSRTGKPLFDSAFLKWLQNSVSNLVAHLTIRAIPEGRVIHPNVPLTTVEGPLALAQLIETPLLNQLNYQTLIATKAARIRESGRGQLLLEFGARRGHEKGANAGTRAALIGGADFSSNSGISHVLGYPPKGTHAHSMIQAFLAMGMSELDAFKAYAEIYPDDCLLLVDTINTLESGIPNAIKVFEELKRKGHKPVGIRLDSGDLAHLSVLAAKMMNDAGFSDTTIVLSNNLDELTIWQIITQISLEAPQYSVDASELLNRLAYGVGTRLITSEGNPALGGVYKLVGLYHNDAWQPIIKISENPQKIPNPGRKHIWRIYDERNNATADLLSLEDKDPKNRLPLTLHHPSDHTKQRKLTEQQIAGAEPLLVDVVIEGQLVYDLPEIEEIRHRRQGDLEKMDAGVKRIMNPHIYHVSLTERLWQLKQHLIETIGETEH